MIKKGNKFIESLIKTLAIHQNTSKKHLKVNDKKFERITNDKNIRNNNLFYLLPSPPSKKGKCFEIINNLLSKIKSSFIELFSFLNNPLKWFQKT